MGRASVATDLIVRALVDAVPADLLLRPIPSEDHAAPSLDAAICHLPPLGSTSASSNQGSPRPLRCLGLALVGSLCRQGRGLSGNAAAEAFDCAAAFLDMSANNPEILARSCRSAASGSSGHSAGVVIWPALCDSLVSGSSADVHAQMKR